MALVLQFNICQSSTCKQLIFNETTGAYDPIANLTGWGSPNLLTSNATVATLTVLAPTGITYVFDIFNGHTPNWPTVINTQNFYMLSSDLGYGINNKFGDGIYTFTYTVIASGVTYTQIKNFMLSCNAKCCVQNLYSDIANDADCTNCQKAKKDIADIARLLLAGIEGAADCGQPATFNSLMLSLSKICGSTNCCC